METRYEIDVASGGIRLTLGPAMEPEELATVLEEVSDDPRYSPELAWIFDARALDPGSSELFEEAVGLMARQALLFIGNEQAIVVSDTTIHRLVLAYQRQMEAMGLRVQVFHDLETAEEWLEAARSPGALTQDPDERRTFRRIEFMNPAVIVPEQAAADGPAGESDATPLPAEVLDLGCGGALLRTYGRVEEGSRWTVRILDPSNPEREADEVIGVIRRSQVKLGASYVGFEFETRLLAVHTGLPIEVSAPLDVLVVDDEPEVQSILQRFFEVHGCEVRTAPDGGEALEALREAPADLVLLDLRMPRMNGLEVLDRIRAQALEVGPVWALSGYVSDQEATTAMRLGAVGFLNKPIDFGFLQRIISVSPLL